jgi:hypothetical protein
MNVRFVCQSLRFDFRAFDDVSIGVFDSIWGGPRQDAHPEVRRIAALVYERITGTSLVSCCRR